MWGLLVAFGPLLAPDTFEWTDKVMPCLMLKAKRTRRVAGARGQKRRSDYMLMPSRLRTIKTAKPARYT